MKIFRKTHDRCIAAFKAIETPAPELAAPALALGVPLAVGTPTHELTQHLTALEAAAIAARLKSRPRQMRHTMTLVSA